MAAALRLAVLIGFPGGALVLLIAPFVGRRAFPQWFKVVCVG
jgi:hypothetical protein